MKQKTSKSALKRFRVTGSGKIRRQKSCKSHLLRYKSKRGLKQARGGHMAVHKTMLKQVKRLIQA